MTLWSPTPSSKQADSISGLTGKMAYQVLIYLLGTPYDLFWENYVSYMFLENFHKPFSLVESKAILWRSLLCYLYLLHFCHLFITRLRNCFFCFQDKYPFFNRLVYSDRTAYHGLIVYLLERKWKDIVCTIPLLFFQAYCSCDLWLIREHREGDQGK